MPRQYYSPAEHATLAAFYPSATRAEVLAALPGRSWHGITMVASANKIRRNTIWSAAEVALLLAEYPLHGAVAVGKMLGKTQLAVIRKAYNLGLKREHASPELRKALKSARAILRYNRLAAERPPRPARVRRPPPVKAPRLVVVKAKPVLLAKPRPMLPNLNAAKQTRKRTEKAATAAVEITAEQIRRLDYSHPGRIAYMLNGVAGWQQWQSEQS